MADYSKPKAATEPVATKSVSATPIKPLRVLNLYAGIGGNRKLWENVEVTAVEHDPQIAAIYASSFPEDTLID